MELALNVYIYMLPRLSGLWTHLNQKGGIGMRTWTEIETTNLIIVRDQCCLAQNKIKTIDKQMGTSGGAVV
jgi:GTP-binding protein HflX